VPPNQFGHAEELSQLSEGDQMEKTLEIALAMFVLYLIRKWRRK
jgi:hypothetical protein